MTTSGETAARSARSALLVALARGAIERELGRDVEPLPVPDDLASWLEEPAATFVTLERGGSLRGCIGSLEAKRALRDDVVANARSAAFEDPRFPPLSAHELPGLSVEVSVLSVPEPIVCRTEAELLAELRPGVDGLVLRCGLHRATFLPQVWGGLPEPADFLAALKRKARLAPDFWSDEMRFLRYTVEKHKAGADLSGPVGSRTAR